MDREADDNLDKDLPEKQGFLSGEDGNRNFGCFRSVFAEVRKAHGLCLIFTVVWS
jgi:hypothetical protein